MRAGRRVAYLFLAIVVSDDGDLQSIVPVSHLSNALKVVEMQTLLSVNLKDFSLHLDGGVVLFIQQVWDAKLSDNELHWRLRLAGGNKRCLQGAKRRAKGCKL
jgi:hypothetical protein